jgi:uncharacterized iron-regulated membrane protein
MAALWGIPFKAFMTLLGMAVAMLSVTGVVIWLRKRRARALSSIKRASAGHGATRSRR